MLTRRRVYVYTRMPAITPTSLSLLRLNKILLLLLQCLRKAQRHLQRPGHNIRRRQRKPLTQANISHPITLINLNPRQIVRLRSILNVMAAVVGEHGCIAGLEVEGAGVAVADEDGGAAGAGVEVEPFLGVGVPVELYVGGIMSVCSSSCCGYWGEILSIRTSRRDPGVSVMNVAARVVAIGKLVESIYFIAH